MHIRRIVIVGLGSMGQKHLNFARNHCPEATIKVLTKYPNNDTIKKADGYFQTVNEIIDFKPQLIIIANPASLHLEVINRIFKVDAFILVEKPLSNNIENIEDFLKTYKNPSLKILVGYNLRFNPSLCYFRQMYKSGILGKIFSVRAEVGQYLPNWRDGIDYNKTVSANKSLGGGVLLELSHEIDYLIWMFGLPQWVTAFVSKVSNLDVDTEDEALMIIGYKNNDNKKNFKVNLNLDFFRHDTKRQCTLIGEKGSIRWDGILGIVERFDTSEKRWIREFCDHDSGNKSYFFEWQHFIDCAKGKDNSLITFQDGMNVLSLIDAARQSSSEKKRININYENVENYYE